MAANMYRVGGTEEFWENSMDGPHSSNAVEYCDP
jgi:hypothetical protein